MDKDPVSLHCLLRHPAQLLMRKVHGVAGLKGDDARPAPLCHLVTDLGRSPKRVGKVGFEVAVIQHFDRSGQQDPPLLLKRCDPRMLSVQRAENPLCNQLQVGVRKRLDSCDRLDRQHGLAWHIGIAQGYAISGTQLTGIGDQVQNRHWPEQSVRSAHVFRDGQRVRLRLIPAERCEIARSEHDCIRRRCRRHHNRRQLPCSRQCCVTGACVFNESGCQLVGTVWLNHFPVFSFF